MALGRSTPTLSRPGRTPPDPACLKIIEPALLIPSIRDEPRDHGRKNKRDHAI
jgi:hypothetical protein